MSSGASPFAFGPVPSRRLGRSLGINNVPPKSCSYSCVYCQVGRTPEGGIEPVTAHLPRVELLTEFEGTAFASAGDPVEDLLATVTVHPMRADAALALLDQAGAGHATLERLVAEGRIHPVSYHGYTFYLRGRSGPREGSTTWS